jgi:phosphoribulokinase
MSERHPIIAITGSSGAGTSSVTRTFENIFRRENVTAAVIEGDSFHRYDRKEMRARMAEAEQAGNKHFSHFGPDNNLLASSKTCSAATARPAPASAASTCTTPKRRHRTSRSPAPSRPGRTCPRDTDMLFYEGLHGAVVTPEVNIARYPDLLIGVVPVINLEWIQKLWRDKHVRGYSGRGGDRHHPAPHARLRELHLPAVRAHARELPARAGGGHLQPLHRARHPHGRREHGVIRFANPKGIDFPYLLNMINARG